MIANCLRREKYCQQKWSDMLYVLKGHRVAFMILTTGQEPFPGRAPLSLSLSLSLSRARALFFSSVVVAEAAA